MVTSKRISKVLITTCNAFLVKRRKPHPEVGWGFKEKGGWRLPTLPHVIAVPLALRGLTTLFGKGRGEHPRYNHHFCTWSIGPDAAYCHINILKSWIQDLVT